MLKRKITTRLAQFKLDAGKYALRNLVSESLGASTRASTVYL